MIILETTTGFLIYLSANVLIYFSYSSELNPSNYSKHLNAFSPNSGVGALLEVGAANTSVNFD